MKSDKAKRNSWTCRFDFEIPDHATRRLRFVNVVTFTCVIRVWTGFENPDLLERDRVEQRAAVTWFFDLRHFVNILAPALLRATICPCHIVFKVRAVWWYEAKRSETNPFNTTRPCERLSFRGRVLKSTLQTKCWLKHANGDGSHTSRSRENALGSSRIKWLPGWLQSSSRGSQIACCVFKGGLLNPRSSLFLVYVCMYVQSLWINLQLNSSPNPSYYWMGTTEAIPG